MLQEVPKKCLYIYYPFLIIHFLNGFLCERARCGCSGTGADY